MTDGFRIKLDGFDEIERELKKLGNDAPKVLRSGMRAGAVVVKKAAQQNLAPHRNTGELADSLKVSTRVDRRTRSIVARVRNTRDTFYGMFLEFGTIHINGVHWLKRALQSNQNRAFDAARLKMAQRIKKIKAKRVR